MTQTQSAGSVCPFSAVCSSGFFILGERGLGFLLFYFSEIDPV